MKYLTVIFFTLIAVYNFQDSHANYVVWHGVYIWQFVWHMTVDITMFGLFWTLSRRTILRWERNLYVGGAYFAAAMTIFNLLTLTSKDVSVYLARVNSVIWGAIMGSLILLILILMLYDKRSS